MRHCQKMKGIEQLFIFNVIIRECLYDFGASACRLWLIFFIACGQSDMRSFLWGKHWHGATVFLTFTGYWGRWTVWWLRWQSTNVASGMCSGSHFVFVSWHTCFFRRFINSHKWFSFPDPLHIYPVAEHLPSCANEYPHLKHNFCLLVDSTLCPPVFSFGFLFILLTDLLWAPPAFMSAACLSARASALAAINTHSRLRFSLSIRLNESDKHSILITKLIELTVFDEHIEPLHKFMNGFTNF